MREVGAALHGDDGDAEGEGDEIHASQLAVLAPAGCPRQPAGQQRHRKPGHETAEPHGDD